MVNFAIEPCETHSPLMRNDAKSDSNPRNQRLQGSGTTIEYYRAHYRHLIAELPETANVKTQSQQSPYQARSIISEIRMSRLSHPRASLFAMLLLAAVFLLFGIVASAYEPSYSPAPNTFEGSARIFGNWLMGHS
jgi:hypothetical protein